MAADETCMMLANNVFRDGTITVTSEDADYPSTNLFDDNRYTQWKATSTATQYIQVQLAAAYQRAVDTLIIDLGHNLLNDAAANIVLQWSSNGSSWTDLVSSQAAIDGIIVEQFTAQTKAYYRLGITGAAEIPTMFQLWAGASFTLGINPTVPFDPNEMESSVIQTVTEAGVPQHSLRYSRRRLRMNWNVINSSFYTNLDQFWTDTAQGSRPFWWIQQPTGDPTDALFMVLDKPALIMPRMGANQRNGSLEAYEVLGY